MFFSHQKNKFSKTEFILKSSNETKQIRSFIPGENKEEKEEFDWKSGYADVLHHIEDYMSIEDGTECTLKDLDFDGIPELHIVTQIGARCLLSDAVIFYYDDSHNLKYTKYTYDFQSAESPELYVNSNSEYAWLVSNLSYDYKTEYNTICTPSYDTSSIEYLGSDASKMTFSNGQMKSTVLIKVEGEKWTGKKPSQFYALGETYDNIDDFFKQIGSNWTWSPVTDTYESIGFSPGYTTPSQEQIDQLLDSYRPLI